MSVRLKPIGPDRIAELRHAQGPELQRCRIVARARDVFTPEEMEQRIQAHAERVAREEPENQCAERESRLYPQAS